MTVVGKRIFIFFGIDGLNIGQILRLTSFAQGDCSWEDFVAFGCGT
ncbi:hypothetical protein HMPREF9225_0115 [Peptoniphilus duerdenii ATCC BAA-1640]|uniref:Uncharacterized protein n=1 Tax=Peptoniphilus duerdenii ATCC BAA-1640 TaxID=862517 RepID=E0NIX6_9FIRM|nr:hypothetical protein HMPREF9225_0115 [Peptoniphilus duerdenii ATCC BAA-1640]